MDFFLELGPDAPRPELWVEYLLPGVLAGPTLSLWRRYLSDSSAIGRHKSLGNELWCVPIKLPYNVGATRDATRFL